MIKEIEKLDTLFVLFGAGGDLSWRLIVPALFDLYMDHHLPERFRIIGIDGKPLNDSSLADHYREGIAQFSRHGSPGNDEWKGFSGKVSYLQTDFNQENCFKRIETLISGQEKDWGRGANVIFYLATPPPFFEIIAKGLGVSGLAGKRERVRIVVEKPIGHDLESFLRINGVLTSVFTEQQIFRIDHFLGKETVQNILAMRFANPMFEPIWNRRYIDHIAITVAETLGVEHRGKFYEQAGALRDMVQNHLMQLLCLVAMEPPVAYDAEDIRGKKLDVLHAVRPIPINSVPEFTARGQYSRGWIDGMKVPGYREEPNVDSRSSAETFAAVKLYVDNWRWQDVPFYLRTGKRMAADLSEISIRFRDVPHRAFPATAGLNAEPARLVIQIQPEQGIVLKFTAKEPGSIFRLKPVDMRFSYQEAFQIPTPLAYETLLVDVIVGDATLFMRADQVETAWRILMPVLDAWKENPATEFPNYTPGSWGPESAEMLVARDGKSWLTPTMKNVESECRVAGVSHQTPAP
ncbi:MAG TPA: glucose-6-phosphate dehydrogenase [Nitrospiria bacterium]|nr:glucose-6-phosphate dehydrogenase [Nitrospiria bacterium]